MALICDLFNTGSSRMFLISVFPLNNQAAAEIEGVRGDGLISAVMNSLLWDLSLAFERR
jgi:hypothetical protein